jgi:branched-chain amino acid transport system permease protein
VLFGIEFKNLGLRLPVLKLAADVHQLLAPAGLRRALIGMGLGLCFSSPHATRGRRSAPSPGPPDHAAHGGRQPTDLLDHLGPWAGDWAGLAACLLVLQYDFHPFVGLSFGPSRS